MRNWLAILSLLILTPGWDGLERLPLLSDRPVISAKRIVLDPADPARVKAGRLTYLGGVELDSPDPVFGGFSAMRVAGDRFTLLSDGGNIVRFRLDADWRLSEPRFAELPDGPGSGWTKGQRDSESLTVEPASGDVLVGFENSNQIWRYDAALARARRHAAPPAMRRWNANGGAESMVRLGDGSVVVIAETTKPASGPGRVGLRFAGDPTRYPGRVVRFAYVPPPGYDPSDAALLPDGRMLVLNRRLSLPFDFTSKLAIVDPAAIRPAARVRGVEIATIAAPFNRDNFEGLAVTQEGADTIVWLVSDDNQLFLERTLLMKFQLEPAPR